MPHTVIGLPSGGTELAFAQQYAYKVMRGEEPELILIPLSLHSIKDAFGSHEVDPAGFHAFIEKRRSSLEGRSILIIEDNSSTGRTIQMLVDLLQRVENVGDVSVSVAEADLIRSQINSEVAHRTHVATAKVYDNSVHVLPISRTLKPKVDLKEIVERKRIAEEYKKRLKGARTSQEQMMYRALVRMCEHPTQEIIRDLNDGNAILEFRHTFLSNFYAIPIEYKGVVYPSVEHAYQSQKFTPDILARVSSDCLNEINETLRYRGRLRTFENANDIFIDETLSSGNVKVIADILRAYGYVRADWDDDKLLLMARLLKQKFKNPEMQRQLQATGAKHLVEGNTWNDTLWGVSNERGRNLLGLMLMDLRSQTLDEQSTID